MAALPKDPAMLLDVARESIETSLAGIGYTYDAEKNQFV